MNCKKKKIAPPLKKIQKQKQQNILLYLHFLDSSLNAVAHFIPCANVYVLINIRMNVPVHPPMSQLNQKRSNICGLYVATILKSINQQTGLLIQERKTQKKH